MDGDKNKPKAEPTLAPRWVWNLWYALILLFSAGFGFVVLYWLFDKAGII